MREMGKDWHKDNQRGKDEDDKRNWIWVKDSKLLSLNTNIKGIVGRGNYETLNKKKIV